MDIYLIFYNLNSESTTAAQTSYTHGNQESDGTLELISPIRSNLSALLISHDTIFFSYNKTTSASLSAESNRTE